MYVQMFNVFYVDFSSWLVLAAISVLTITMGFGSYFLHLIEVSKLPGLFSVKFTKYSTIKRILLLLFVDSSSKA